MSIPHSGCCCFIATGPPCWWQQPLPPSFSLPVYRLREYMNRSLLCLSYYLVRIRAIYLPLLGLRNMFSCVSEHKCTSSPAYFLLTASRWRCSAYKQLTASTILWSHDLGHYQIRAITCCNSSLHSSFLGSGSAAEWENRRVHSCHFPQLERIICVSKCRCFVSTCVERRMWSSRFVSPTAQLQDFITPQG